jgi:putative addiction module component (TIGR02574 family)
MNQSGSEISFDHLNIAERITLVQRIWDSIAEEEKKLEITPEFREELARRLAAHRADPERSRPWDEVKARLQSKP